MTKSTKDKRNIKHVLRQKKKNVQLKLRMREVTTGAGVYMSSFGNCNLHRLLCYFFPTEKFLSGTDLSIQKIERSTIIFYRN